MLSCVLTFQAAGHADVVAVGGGMLIWPLAGALCPGQDLELIRPQDYYSRFHFSVRTKVGSQSPALCGADWAACLLLPSWGRPCSCHRAAHVAASASPRFLPPLQRFGPDTVTVYCICQLPENPDTPM